MVTALLSRLRHHCTTIKIDIPRIASACATLLALALSVLLFAFCQHGLRELFRSRVLRVRRCRRARGDDRHGPQDPRGVRSLPHREPRRPAGCGAEACGHDFGITERDEREKTPRKDLKTWCAWQGSPRSPLSRQRRDPVPFPALQIFASRQREVPPRGWRYLHLQSRLPEIGQERHIWMGAAGRGRPAARPSHARDTRICCQTMILGMESPLEGRAGALRKRGERVARPLPSSQDDDTARSAFSGDRNRRPCGSRARRLRVDPRVRGAGDEWLGEPAPQRDRSHPRLDGADRPGAGRQALPQRLRCRGGRAAVGDGRRVLRPHERAHLRQHRRR